MSNTGPDVSTDGGTTATSKQREPEVVGGLDPNVAGVLCYLFQFVSGLVFYLIEEDNEFVRFHAAQSMVVFGGLFVAQAGVILLSELFGIIPVIGFVFGFLFGLASYALGVVTLVLWLVLMFKAYEGEQWEVPLAGDVTKSLL